MKSFPAILVLLAFAGCSTNSPTSGFKPGSAIVRAAHGEVQYWNGRGWDLLRPNTVLTNGALIRTGVTSAVDLSIGRSAVVRLTADSELDLTAMDADGTVTALELRKGTILGSVKKLSPKATFQVRNGEFMLELRKGDFSMSAGGWVSAVKGEMTVRAGGKTYQLRTAHFFNPEKNEVVEILGSPG